eukprot:8546224-Pyramimonas_sp.AAC.1
MSGCSERQKTGWHWHLCAAAESESTGALKDFGGGLGTIEVTDDHEEAMLSLFVSMLSKCLPLVAKM